jgi:hypothetical protein
LSPRELAVNFTDTTASFVLEASVYRLLKDHGLIASPAFILIRAADRFANPTTAPNQLWRTDFTGAARLRSDQHAQGRWLADARHKDHRSAN